LAETYTEKLPIADLEKFLEPLLMFFKEARVDNGTPESFGDFCHRVGFGALRSYAETYVPAKSRSERNRLRYRVNLKPSVFEDLKQAAQVQGRTLADIASDAIEAYLKQSQVGR
jgi:sulfite reductase (ferredoxin)